MNILYCGAFRFPTGDAASARVLNNAKILRSLGHTVDFLAFGGEQKKDTYQGFKYSISYDLDIKMGCYKIMSLFFCGYKSIKLIYKNIEKYQIIIVYNPPAFFCKKIINICKKYNRKLILDSTEWYSYRDFPYGFFNPSYFFSQISEIFIKPQIKNVISISCYLYEHFRKSPNRIILPPLVDLKEVKWSLSTNILKKYPGKTFIYAGNAGNKKDRIDIVLDAFENVIIKGYDMRLLILGSTKVLYRNDNQKRLLEPYVYSIGRVPQEEVPSYYNIADFSILIRKSNRKNNAGFSTKLVESIVAGVPPITTKTSDVEYYLDNKKNCLILNHANVVELTKCLVNVNKINNLKLSQMKKNLSEIAKQYFYFESYKEQMRFFLKKLK